MSRKRSLWAFVGRCWLFRRGVGAAAAVEVAVGVAGLGCQPIQSSSRGGPVAVGSRIYGGTLETPEILVPGVACQQRNRKSPPFVVVRS